MRPVSATTVIDVPRERVFDFVGDLANRESFTRGFIDQLRLERLPSSGVGAAARFYVNGRGIAMWMETVVEEADAPAPDLRARARRPDRPDRRVHGLGAGRRARRRDRGHGHRSGRSRRIRWDRFREKFGHARRFRRRWRSAVEQLRDVLESGAAIEPVRVAGEPRLPV